MTNEAGSERGSTGGTQAAGDLSVERVRDLMTDINDLQRQISELRLRLLDYERQPTNTVAYYLVFLGACSLIFSIVWTSQILAFIGLGLTFWGALLLYARPVAYLPVELINSTAISSMRALDQIIGKLGYEGRSIYLPPMTLKDIKDSRMFLPAKDGMEIPTREAVAKGALMVENPEGILLVPVGLGLANLFEEKLGVSFVEVDLDYLTANLPRLLSEDLRLLEDLELQEDGDVIQISMAGSACASLCSQVRKEADTSSRFGCPLCSAMAIVLARSTHRHIVVEGEEVSEDGKKTVMRFRMLAG